MRRAQNAHPFSVKLSVPRATLYHGPMALRSATVLTWVWHGPRKALPPPEAVSSHRSPFEREYLAHPIELSKWGSVRRSSPLHLPLRPRAHELRLVCGNGSSGYQRPAAPPAESARPCSGDCSHSRSGARRLPRFGRRCSLTHVQPGRAVKAAVQPRPSRSRLVRRQPTRCAAGCAGSSGGRC